MAIDIEKIATLWGGDKPKYQMLGEIVTHFIKSTITDYEILPEISFRSKELISIIKKIKKKKQYKDYSYFDLNDKLGIRIICSFQEEMDIIDTFLLKHFTIINVEYKKEELDFDTLGYISNHYDASIDINLEYFKKHHQLKDLVFEIQVRTLNQHAWSNAAHSLSYKLDSEIPPKLNRRIYRLLSLYEIADDEISAVNNKLRDHPDNNIYKILKKLEGKIYKFAQIDYDRETSINAIRILLGYFSNEEIVDIYSSIEQFISENTSKIQRIFNENRPRYYEVPFLTQPEIFIVWFALEKYPFSIDDKWQNDFDAYELEYIKNIWGRIID